MRCVLFASLLTLASCASTTGLPRTASEANFTAIEGKTGWSSYQERAHLANVDLRSGYEAAKASLAQSDFSLARADMQAGVVIGEHGITWKDWNVVAAIYLRPRGPDLDVLVMVEGSKDVGITGDSTSEAWTGMLIRGMRENLKRN